MNFLNSLSLRIRIGLAVIVALLAFEYLWAPLYERRRDNLTQVVRLREAVARKQALVGRQGEVAAAAVEAEKRLTEISRHFYPGIGEAATLQLTLQQQVESLVASLGGRVVNLDWLPATGAGPVVKASIRFRLEIEPTDLTRLLHTLESDPRLLVIEQLNLTARAKTAELTTELVVTAHGTP